MGGVLCDTASGMEAREDRYPKIRPNELAAVATGPVSVADVIALTGVPPDQSGTSTASNASSGLRTHCWAHGRPRATRATMRLGQSTAEIDPNRAG